MVHYKRHRFYSISINMPLTITGRKIYKSIFDNFPDEIKVLSLRGPDCENSKENCYKIYKFCFRPLLQIAHKVIDQVKLISIWFTWNQFLKLLHALAHCSAINFTEVNLIENEEIPLKVNKRTKFNIWSIAIENVSKFKASNIRKLIEVFSINRSFRRSLDSLWFSQSFIWFSNSESVENIRSDLKNYGYKTRLLPI